MAETAHNRATTLPDDPKERKKFPIATGVLDYFPDALLAVAQVSYVGNEQHNPGEPLHWARGKSMDQDDTAIRHFLERGKIDKDGVRHSAKLAWRVLALLQLEIEAEQTQATKSEAIAPAGATVCQTRVKDYPFLYCSRPANHHGDHVAHDLVTGDELGRRKA